MSEIIITKVQRYEFDEDSGEMIPVASHIVDYPWNSDPSTGGYVAKACRAPLRKPAVSRRDMMR